MAARLIFLLVLSPVLLPVLPASAQGSEAGQACTLTQELPFKLGRGRADALQTSLAVGQRIELIQPGPHTTRVLADGAEGLVPSERLALACAPAERHCTLEQTVTMTGPEAADGKRRAWRVKPGALVDVIEAGPAVTRVRIGNLSGDMQSADLEAACVAPQHDEELVRLLEAVGPVPRGTTLLVLPLATSGGVDAERVERMEAELVAALAQGRSDVTGPTEVDPLERRSPSTLEAGLQRAHKVGLASKVPFVLVGHLAPPGSEGGPYALTLALLDVQAGRMAKGVKSRPTLHPADPWARAAAARLLAGLPQPDRPTARRTHRSRQP